MLAWQALGCFLKSLFSLKTVSARFASNVRNPSNSRTSGFGHRAVIYLETGTTRSRKRVAECRHGGGGGLRHSLREAGSAEAVAFADLFQSSKSAFFVTLSEPFLL
jgi:hypothetical protein